jgi:hypothetical protein
MFLSLGWTCYILQCLPFVEKVENITEVVNACLFLAFGYTLPGFTLIILDPADRYKLGFTTIGILALLVLINITTAVAVVSMIKIKKRFLLKIIEKKKADRE